MTSGEDASNWVPVDVGKPEVATTKAECQILVIKSEQMENRGVEVTYAVGVLDDTVAVIVGLSVDESLFDTTAR